MKNYLAAILAIVLLLSPMAVYAAEDMSLRASSISATRGSNITLSGTIPAELGEVSIKVVRPDGTLFFFDVVEAAAGRFNSVLEIPTEEKLAPNGIYTAVAGYGAQQATATFSVGAVSPGPGQPSVPDGNTAADEEVIDGMIKPQKNNDHLYKISAQAVTEAIKQGKDSVVIELPSSSEDGVQFELATASWRELAAADKPLTILLGKSELHIPAGAMPIGGDYTRISVSTKWTGELQDTVQDALQAQDEYKETAVAVSVVIEQVNGGSVTIIHNLNEPIEVELVLTDTQKQQINSSLAGIYYVDGEKLEYVKVRFNGNKASFITEHFSTYALLEYDKQFTDMAGHWANEAVHSLAAKHIVTGVDESHYRPTANITRADFVTLIMRAKAWETGEESLAAAHEFSDVRANLYYTEHVAAAAELGIITGYNGQFRPSDSITREEATAVLVRASEYFNTNEKVQGAMPFTDRNEIASWATSFVEQAWTLGLVQGDGGKFKPQQSLARSEVAVMIDRLLTNGQTN